MLQEEPPKVKNMIEEFKKFIARGNVIDMAVGIIIGAAFTAIVNSLVSDIIMPIVAIATGGIDFQDWKITLIGDNAIMIGQFINAVISFFLISLVVFFIIKAISLVNHKPAEVPTTRTCPYCKSDDVSVSAVKCPHCGSEIEPVQ